MKVPAQKIESFIASPDSTIRSALIYGPDVGLISQRSSTLMKWAAEDINDPFNVVEIHCTALSQTPSLIADELASISLMGGRRLVIVKEAGNSHSSILKSALEASFSSEQAFLLVMAGDLKPGSLRSLFENRDDCAAIACYQDDVRGLTHVVSQKLLSMGMSFDPDVCAYVAMNSQGDRMVVLSEIEKLCLFLGDKKYVSLDDAKSVIGETTQSHLDDICNAIAMGNHGHLEHHLRKALSQGIMPIVILRSVGRFFSRIQLTHGLILKGNTPENALKQLRPPVFFKQLPLFKQFLNKFSSTHMSRLWPIIDELYHAELECKKTGRNANLMCSRSLMKITSLSK